MDVAKIKLTDHAVDRWNDRVGPIVSKEQLRELFDQIERHPSICQFMKKVTTDTTNVMIIDDDIVALYEYSQSAKTKEKYMNIVTFFGRISLNHLLVDIGTTLRYLRRSKDVINLHVPLEDVKKQTLPSVAILKRPTQFIGYNGEYRYGFSFKLFYNEKFEVNIGAYDHLGFVDNNVYYDSVYNLHHIFEIDYLNETQKIEIYQRLRKKIKEEMGISLLSYDHYVEKNGSQEVSAV